MHLDSSSDLERMESNRLERERRMDAVEQYFDDPKFIEKYGGRYILVEKGENGIYQVISFRWKLIADWHYKRSDQRDQMPFEPMYILRKDEIQMGPFIGKIPKTD